MQSTTLTLTYEAGVDFTDRVHIARAVRRAAVRVLHDTPHVLMGVISDPTGYTVATRDGQTEPRPCIEIRVDSHDVANATTLLREAFASLKGVRVPQVGPVYA